MSNNYRDNIYAQYVTLAERQNSSANNSARTPYLRRIMKRHLARVELTAKVLDLGCGDGSLLMAMQECGFVDLTGVDRSSEQTELAKRMGFGDIIEDDILKYLKSVPSQSIEVIVAFDVIEHLKKDEISELMHEVYRVMCPGGLFLFHVPNAGSPFFGRVAYGDFTHESYFTGRSIYQLLRSFGFIDIACFEDTPTVHGVASLIRHLLWHAVRSVYKFVIVVEVGGVDEVEVFSQNILATASKPLPSI